MIINVGSTSKHKVGAVDKALKALSLFEFDVVSHDVPSGVRSQPYGLDETSQGAINRAQGCWSRGAYSVGIEGGIITLPTYYSPNPALCLAVICLVTPDGKCFFSTSAGMQFPDYAVLEARKLGTTVGKVLSDAFGGDHTDPRSIVSKGRMSREDSLVEAVKLALIQVF
jgi:inosine/xanthosine triphosphatase